MPDNSGKHHLGYSRLRYGQFQFRRFVPGCISHYTVTVGTLAFEVLMVTLSTNLGAELRTRFRKGHVRVAPADLSIGGTRTEETTHNLKTWS